MPYGAVRVSPGELAQYPAVLPSERQQRWLLHPQDEDVSQQNPFLHGFSVKAPTLFQGTPVPCPLWLLQTVSCHCGNNCSKTLETRVDPEFLEIQILRSSWLSA